MKLNSITIENYRSIKKATFAISEIDGSHTYTLIGINETGKSSFLTAVSLLNEGKVVFPRDYFDEEEPITISFSYELTPDDRKGLKQVLAEKGLTKDLLSRIDVKSVNVTAIYERLPHPSEGISTRLPSQPRFSTTTRGRSPYRSERPTPISPASTWPPTS